MRLKTGVLEILHGKAILDKRLGEGIAKDPRPAVLVEELQELAADDVPGLGEIAIWLLRLSRTARRAGQAHTEHQNQP